MVDLEVVGRHAMLFDDDANAVFVNSEEALVDWNSLLIDRYDVRHLLSSPPPPRNRGRQAVPHADASIATELDRERYLDLPSDEQEPDVNEEVVPVADVGYRAVGFCYGNLDEVNEQKNNDVESVYHPHFPVPESLIQNLPPTEKVHQIIARTATFVIEHGGQSEIVLRVKQGDNPTFGFLMPDHHLHPYFRFLVDHQELLKSNGNGKQEKTGSNIPGQTSGALSLLGSVYGYEEEEDGAAEDLPGINKSQENVDTVSATVSHGSESSGNAAVKNEILSNNNMTEKMSAIKRNLSINSVKNVAASAVNRNGDIAESAGTSTTKTQTPALPPSIAKVELPVLEPPSELKRVVEKIVEFILRNGKEFEAVLAEQDRKFGRFPFLLPSNPYHSYYLQTLQKTQDQSKLASKASSSEKHESTSRRREKKTSRRDVGTLSTGISDGDIPNDYDRKEKFKMALSKSKKNVQDPPLKVKPPPPQEIVIDAEAAAAILKAATRGVKDPALETFPKQAHTNFEDRSSNIMSQTQSFIRNKIAIGEPSVSVLAANAMAETAARAAAIEADSSEASLTKEQKLKAERLKRAKMFAAMIKKGAAPLKPEPIRSLSAEPTVSGVSSSGNEAVNPKVGKEGEGSSVPVDVDTSEKIDESEKKAVDEFNERRSRRSYRSRSKREEERDEDEEDEEDRRDNKRSKKHRSHRSSRHGGDSYRHRKRHSSSKHGSEKYSDDDGDDDEDRYSRHRHRHSSSDDDKDDYERRSSRKKRNRYHRSSDDDRDRHRSRSAKQRERGSGKEVELEEGEIGGAKSDQSKTNESRQASREASVDLLKSQPSESTVVPDDLRAKVRAMLMATM